MKIQRYNDPHHHVSHYKFQIGKFWVAQYFKSINYVRRNLLDKLFSFANKRTRCWESTSRRLRSWSRWLRKVDLKGEKSFPVRYKSNQFVCSQWGTFTLLLQLCWTNQISLFQSASRYNSYMYLSTWEVVPSEVLT